MSPDQPAGNGSSGRSRRGSRGGRGRSRANGGGGDSTPSLEPRVVGRRPGRAKASEQAEEQATTEPTTEATAGATTEPTAEATTEAKTERPATRRRRRSGSAATEGGESAQETPKAEETEEAEKTPARPRRRRSRASTAAEPDAATTEPATTAEAAATTEPDATTEPATAAEAAATTEAAVTKEPAPTTPTRRRARRTETAADAGASTSLEAVATALQAVQVALQDLSERVERTARRQRLGIFVDVPNVLYGGERSEQPIDMGKLLDYLHEGRELVRATAYSPISDDPREPVERQRFVAPFVPHQYRIVTKPLKRFADGSIKGNFDVEMAIDMVTMAERLDVIAIVSGDADFARVVELVQSRGVKVEVIAFQNSASSEMRAIADEFIELDGLVDRLR